MRHFTKGSVQRPVCTFHHLSIYPGMIPPAKYAKNAKEFLSRSSRIQPTDIAIPAALRHEGVCDRQIARRAKLLYQGPRRGPL
jgi:hypothetical protein